ncbi:MAG: DUF4388 domain-containing protein [Candidatus Krumholzibacteria bacterium]|nr:DUF4388 domain-containing protein [Candidatus Krumholzibacteria bacterium]
MKKERLDHILLRLGYVTKREIRQALSQQKANFGRLGSHLLYLGFITEQQLVHALSLQYKTPGFFLDEHDISRAAVEQLPFEVAEHYEALPIDHNATTATVTVAAVDPSNHDMIMQIRRTFATKHVKVYVASQPLLRLLINQYYRRKTDDSPTNRARIPDSLNGRFGDAATHRRSNSNSLGKMAEQEVSSEKPLAFRASFRAFSLIDLLQALGQSSKTVRIDLTRSTGEAAEIYMRRGQIVHAVCGSQVGAEAVYRVISWGDDGRFSVEPTEHLPADNIFEANEAILMESCRLLDESQV